MNLTQDRHRKSKRSKLKLFINSRGKYPYASFIADTAFYFVLSFLLLPDIFSAKRRCGTAERNIAASGPRPRGTADMLIYVRWGWEGRRASVRRSVRG